MSAIRWWTFAALAVITLCGFFVFPGHTYLHQDSQIYLPMMERLWNSKVLGNDLIAIHPHLSFTFYDEIAIALRSLTGADFQAVLVAQQLLTRLLGLIGVFLLARSAGLGYGAGVMAAGLYGLGATIGGPAVLTIEYEPSPRSLALPLVILAMGSAAVDRWTLAGAAAFLGFLYHPPTVAPVLALLILYVLLPRGSAHRRQFLGWIAAALAVIVIAAKLQAGVRLEQEFFARVSPDVEQLQRMRAAYVFVGVWFKQYWTHYAFLGAVALAAWWRAADHLDSLSRFLLAALPALGLASVPLSYAAMEVMGWSLIPQLQPARSLLWTTFAATVSCGIAVGLAKRLWERTLWLLLALAIAVQVRILDLAWPSTPALWQRLALLCGLALFLALIAHLGPAAQGAAIAVTMALLLYVGGIRNYPVIHSPELDALSAWARTSTPVESVFHFPDAGKDLAPGIFRARALRAVWVDWKGGGQVNFMEPLAREWWKRWSALPAGNADYLVRKTGRCGEAPLYSNARFCVERP